MCIVGIDRVSCLVGKQVVGGSMYNPAGQGIEGIKLMR